MNRITRFVSDNMADMLKYRSNVGREDFLLGLPNQSYEPNHGMGTMENIFYGGGYIQASLRNFIESCS